MHLSHADAKVADKVETGLFTALLGEFVLGYRIVTCDFGDGREEEVGTVGEPFPRS